MIAGAYWTAFRSAATVTIGIAVMSWLAFGSDSWHAFFPWMPTFSQAALSEIQPFTPIFISQLVNVVAWTIAR
jgi:hypothetical protein